MTTTARMEGSRGLQSGDVVVVPFPFTDRTTTRRRPALVCSTAEFNQRTGHVLLAMITSAAHSDWSDDVRLTDLDAAGLPVPSVVRWKLFTLDQRLVLRTAGRLAEHDRAACRRAIPVGV
jgi:mRNA interferase MazF